MKLKPLRDQVILEPVREEKKKGGIILPDTADKERPEQGKVIAVGPGRLNDKGERIAPEVKKGDFVIFTKYGPHEVKVEEKEYLIAEEKDILAIVDKK
ncbi:MAG: co-chaperone GroES [Candidatus Yanofskybacteria bacterium CG10_big_fil_rev_8_21_14_0_10_46_23]|uniref:Co-chaperonin GroES n=1 Tax=Candidatus Yanofskybacteria bacterium CG10_big_fil_rev_8_21_14_0_10_46_23 TaxID=1975098 RepID=A0A2H0R4Z6_9BACT|nr:MAG: co-chaperone GroES [Candidatus Yanofskybacteria bacterium CG10_big_fil_rev_8_21_14_0_10_46_23]